MQKTINKMLIDMGITPNLSGYRFLSSAISMAIDNPDLITAKITKTLYPDIARLHKSTSIRVERAIRHAIEVAYTKGDATGVLGVPCDYSKCKLTNSAFIAVCAEKARGNI